MIELALAVVGAVGFVISIIAWNIRRSRCFKCETPCCKIERELMSQESMEKDPLPKL